MLIFKHHFIGQKSFLVSWFHSKWISSSSQKLNITPTVTLQTVADRFTRRAAESKEEDLGTDSTGPEDQRRWTGIVQGCSVDDRWQGTLQGADNDKLCY